MKYIKQFESVEGRPITGSPIEVTYVDFSMGGDGCKALYINGKLHKYGDDYHDKIDNYIGAFVDGLKWAGVNMVYKKVYSKSNYWYQETTNNGNPPPGYLEDSDEEINELLGVGNIVRNLANVDEFDGHDVHQYLLDDFSSPKFTYEEKRGKTGELIKSYSFEMEDKLVKAELSTWFKIRTPGSTEYHLFMDGKKLSCSRRLCKIIFNIIEKLYRQSK